MVWILLIYEREEEATVRHLLTMRRGSMRRWSTNGGIHYARRLASPALISGILLFSIDFIIQMILYPRVGNI
jgi:hypothetical protein